MHIGLRRRRAHSGQLALEHLAYQISRDTRIGWGRRSRKGGLVSQSPVMLQTAVVSLRMNKTEKKRRFKRQEKGMKSLPVVTSTPPARRLPSWLKRELPR